MKTQLVEISKYNLARIIREVLKQAEIPFEEEVLDSLMESKVRNIGIPVPSDFAIYEVLDPKEVEIIEKDSFDMICELSDKILSVKSTLDELRTELNQTLDALEEEQTSQYSKLKEHTLAVEEAHEKVAQMDKEILNYMNEVFAKEEGRA